MEYNSLCKIDDVSGSRSNWGSNRKKIIRDGDYVYTFVNYIHPDNPENLTIGPGTEHNQVYIYFVVTRDGEQPVFSKDYFLASGNATMLLDSKRRLHAFYFKPDRKDENNIYPYKGKIVHVTFPNPGDLNVYDEEDITPGWEEGNETEFNFSSFYFGADIDEADRIMLVYENTPGGGGIKDSYTLSCRYGILDENGNYQWRYQRVKELTTRHCYPTVLSTPDGWYVCAVQDQKIPSGEYQFDELRIFFAPAENPLRRRIKEKVQDIRERLESKKPGTRADHESVEEGAPDEFVEDDLVWDVVKVFDGAEGYFGFTFYGDLLLDKDRKTVHLVFVYGYYDYGKNKPSYNNQTYEYWKGKKNSWNKQWNIPEGENYQPIKGSGEMRPQHPWKGTNIIRLKQTGTSLYFICNSWSNLYAYRNTIDESGCVMIYTYEEAKRRNIEEGNPEEPEIEGYNTFTCVPQNSVVGQGITDLVVYGNSDLEPQIAMLMIVKLE